MLEVKLDPPRGAAGVEIGMTMEAAEQVLASLPGYVGPGRAKGSRGTAHFSTGMTIQAHGDDAGRVEAVEIYRPTEPGVRVLYGDISIFEEPAEIVEGRLAGRLPLQVIDDGLTVVAPETFMALGKSTSVYGDDSESGFFESVVVARPGYYEDL
ncbi:hypothetical protein [Couchioplanes azureus]|uniref:hypothetical protein n=1 Tax=Couchioplanes caeruleus TaxID=56438 RepID=UPI00166FA221|nr:hypothetical protein [Couchioplanes caeruleus]GGQ44302.1 hypothetical protein GCM10010166_11020 [Couchioplanes caeruleus subsp. azureus]